MVNCELAGFFGAGCCNVHMSGAGTEKAVGRRFGTRHDVALDVVVTSGPSTFDFSTSRSGCYFSTLDF